MAGRFAADPLNLDALAQQAAVDVVLIGTLLRAGDRLRVSTQLVEVPSGTVLWSQSAEVRIGDIFQLQDSVVRHVPVQQLAIARGQGH